MNVLDLFSGLGGWSAPWAGHPVCRVDLNPDFSPDICADVASLSPLDLPFKPDVVLASPPCEAFSVAAIGHHWTGGKRGYIPATEHAETSLNLIRSSLALIRLLEPQVAILENPRGMMRRVVPELDFIERVTVTYCSYGESRMKPTDLWGLPFPSAWHPRVACHNGDPCHERAPRGSRTGTQGIQGAAARAVVPYELASDIMNATLAS